MVSNSNPGFAEISIDGHGGNLYGSLVQMSPGGAIVRLERASPATRTGQVRSGSPAGLTIVTGSAMFTVGARVVSEVADDIALAFSSDLKNVQRRSDLRLGCDLSVMYRTKRPEGRSGAWQTGSSYDVSVTGICLKLDQGGDVTKYVELCFMLSAEDGEGPIRATGRIAHQRLRADGAIAVGIAFTAISFRDRMRLVRFIK